MCQHSKVSIKSQGCCQNTQCVISWWFVIPVDAASVDIDQFDLQTLSDGLRRYLQDLPYPVVPASVYSEMVHVAQGKDSVTTHEANPILKLCAK